MTVRHSAFTGCCSRRSAAQRPPPSRPSLTGRCWGPTGSPGRIPAPVNSPLTSLPGCATLSLCSDSEDEGMDLATLQAMMLEVRGQGLRGVVRGCTKPPMTPAADMQVSRGARDTYCSN